MISTLDLLIYNYKCHDQSYTRCCNNE